MSQTELAARASIARNTLNRIENGHLMPTAPVIERLAEALGVTPGALFEEPALAAGKAEAWETGRPEEEAEVRSLEIPYMDRPVVRDWLAANGHMSREEFISWVGELEGMQGIEGGRVELHDQRNRLLRDLKRPAARKALFPTPSEAQLSQEEIRNWLLKPPGRRKLEQEIRREYSARELALVNYSRQLFVEGKAEDYLIYTPAGEHDHQRHEQMLEARRRLLEETADDAGVA